MQRLCVCAGSMALLRSLVIVSCAVAAWGRRQDEWSEDYEDSTLAPISYKGHALVRFSIGNDADKATFDAAVEKHGLDVWAQVPGKHSIARVPPSVQLAKLPFEHTVLNKDIAPLLLSEKRPAGNGFHQRYHSAKEIEEFTQQLAKKYPKVVKKENLGKSVDGMPISVVHINSGEDKPIVFVQAGQHAREWIGPAATMVMLEAMAKKASGSDLGFQLSVAPLVNPDGYQYTHTKNRMWRKNRDKHTDNNAAVEMADGEAAQYRAYLETTQDQDLQDKCVGVDLNRNWATHWAKTMKNNKVSPDKVRPCSETFVGLAEGNEPEVKAIASHIKKHKKRVKAFLDVHSYSQRLLPPGCNGFRVPKKDKKKHMDTGKKMVQAMSDKGGKSYETGDCAKEMYVCSGTAADWAYNEQKILHSYSLELRPGHEPQGNGFVLPPGQIHATGEELLVGVQTLAKHSTDSEEAQGQED